MSLNTIDYQTAEELHQRRQEALLHSVSYFGNPREFGFYGLAAVAQGANPASFQLPTDYPDDMQHIQAQIARISNCLETNRSIQDSGHIDYLLAVALQKITDAKIATVDPQNLLTLARVIKSRIASCYDDFAEPGIPMVNTIIAKLRDTAYELLYPDAFEKVTSAVENVSGIDRNDMYNTVIITQLIQRMLHDSCGAIDWDSVHLVGNVKPIVSRISALLDTHAHVGSVDEFLAQYVPERSPDELEKLFWMQKDGLRAQAYPNGPASFDDFAHRVLTSVIRSKHDPRLLPHRLKYGLKPYAYIRKSSFPENKKMQFQTVPTSRSARQDIVLLQAMALSKNIVQYAALHALMFLPAHSSSAEGTIHITHFPVEMQVRMGTQGLRALGNMGSHILRTQNNNFLTSSYATIFGTTIESAFDKAREELRQWM